MASATAAVTAKAAQDTAEDQEIQDDAELETGDGKQQTVQADKVMAGADPAEFPKFKAAGGTGGGGSDGTHTHGMPFKMKASSHGNSPVEKNFGSKEARGFPMSNFGVNSTEKQGGVGSEMEPPLKSGSSPAKGLWGNLKAKAKKMLGINKGGAARGIVEQGGIAATSGAAAAGGGGGGGGAHTHGADGSVEAAGGGGAGKGGKMWGGISDPVAAGGAMNTVGEAPMEEEEGVAAAGVASDRRLKKNIKLTGKSPSGLNVYNFEYTNSKHGEGVFQGVMSDEVPSNAVINNGMHDMVNYDILDVEFKRIN